MATLDIDSIVALWCLGCALAGASLGVLLCRIRSAGLEERIRGESRAEIATLQERVAARELSVQQLTGELDRTRAAEKKLEEASQTIQQDLVRVTEELRHAKEQNGTLTVIQEQFQAAFKALSADALRSNNQSFIELAKSTFESLQVAATGDLDKRQTAITEMVKPVRETLERFDAKVTELEKARIGAYEGLFQQVRTLADGQVQLKSETTNLVRALGTPRVRGRWGEIQLRRVVELAGMMDHCDFYEQQSVDTEEGRLRPDLLVQLPGGKTVVVDAKAPLAGYLEALESEDESLRAQKFADHARHIREHASSLGRKSYWQQFSPAPEFVVLFLPGEAFFSAALQQDPELIEQALANQVLLATPTTLIALLKAVAYGWRQEALTENAEQIRALGHELYKRLADMGVHLNQLGTNLDRAVEGYNKTVATLESRVLVSGRRFKELQSAGVEKEIPQLEPIDRPARKPQAPELTEPALSAT